MFKIFPDLFCNGFRFSAAGEPRQKNKGKSYRKTYEPVIDPHLGGKCLKHFSIKHDILVEFRLVLDIQLTNNVDSVAV